MTERPPDQRPRPGPEPEPSATRSELPASGPDAEPQPDGTVAPVPEHAPRSEPTPEPTPAPAAEAPPEPTEPTPEQVSELIPEGVSEPTPEPTPEQVSEPPPEAPPEPTPEQVSEPAPEAPTEPTPEQVSEPTPEGVSEPTPEARPQAVSEPAPETVTEPTPETPTEPTPRPSMSPAAQSDPAAGPAPTGAPHAPTPAEVPHAPAAEAVVAPAPSVPASDPTEWGRVADDGTVFVRTAEGERPVGSYPEADHHEALAYFGRKFDELAGQVALLEQRIHAGGVAPKDASTTAGHLRESIADAHAVGDLAGLLARLDVVEAEVEKARARSDRARAAARQRATDAKERIVSEAETLAASTDWKRTGDRLRALLEEWKKVPRLDRKADDALWKRFSHARTSFDKSRRAHFAELDVSRGEAAQVKEKLIKKAVELSTSKEWGETAKAYRDLMSQWKAAGRARRDVEDELWARFRAAQDVFFSARSAVFAERDAGQAENLEKKQALAAEAEKLLPLSDHRAARTTLRSIHERWEAVGHVPRNDRDGVENRLRKVDDAVRAAEEAEWARSNPEARARAEATVTQLRASIESLDQDAAAARAAGNETKAAEAEQAAATRRTWLVEAEKTLAEFS